MAQRGSERLQPAKPPVHRQFRTAKTPVPISKGRLTVCTNRPRVVGRVEVQHHLGEVWIWAPQKGPIDIDDYIR